MTTEYAELEIGLHHRDEASWAVELRFDQPGADAEVILQERAVITDLDLRKLRELEDQPDEYGRALGRAFFGTPAVRDAYAQAYAAALSHRRRLRVRLFIGQSAPELHALRWETLADPADGSRLTLDENVLFSRYLNSYDWRRSVGPGSWTGLRALVVVADPHDLSGWDVGRTLARVDVDAEIARARAALDQIDVAALPGVGRPTISELFEQLRGGVDVLYLVCHGFRSGGSARLLLETDDGTADSVNASELVERIRDLPQPPRLVVLASCQSAGGGAQVHSDDGGVLAALGPQLAQAGVPAVLAMQGDVALATVQTFLPSFFGALRADGQIDRAMAIARGEIRDRTDWWAPTLFMRITSGRLWYSPGGGDEGPFEQWASLLDQIARNKCTPLVGPGVSDSLLGVRSEIAGALSRAFRFPLAPHRAEEMPHVAQYLSVVHNPDFPRTTLLKWLSHSIVNRYGAQLPAHLAGGRSDELDETELARRVNDQIGAAWEIRHRLDSDDPIAALARVPFPVYVTTHMSDLLADALRQAGREPVVELCRWRDDTEDDPVDWPESIFDSEPDYEPTRERPLVFHLFGHLSVPESVVLTEDDYFDFLIGISADSRAIRIPEVVRANLTNCGLLLLGFRPDEWDFRVLFRSIMQLPGAKRRRKYTNVSVQIDPEEGTATQAQKARKYLEKYFGESRMTVFWGRSDDFLRDLGRLWDHRAATREPS